MNGRKKSILNDLICTVLGSLILEAILDFEPSKNILKPPLRFFFEKSDPVSPTSQKVLLSFPPQKQQLL